MKILTILLFLVSTFSSATGLNVENAIFYNEGERAYVSMDISWNNAFHLETSGTRHWDAAWVFFKLRKNDGSDYYTIHVKPSGHRTVKNGKEEVNLNFQPAKDGMGLFVSLAGIGEQDINARVVIELVQANFEGINLRNCRLLPYALEMVYIPEGPVTLGSPNTTDYGALFLSDKEGGMKGLFQVNKQDQTIEVGAEINNLYYQAQEGYEGDQKGTIGTEFPKGVNGFYIMKYEPTQGQYVDFLNSLPATMQEANDISQSNGYYDNRGTIRKTENGYVADKPDQPCNYIGWDEGMAFADWAGLRPMTEFEYTKACRGSNAPVANEFPWNTGEKVQVRRQIDTNGNLVYLGLDEADITDDNRDLYGVSLFRVHDLAGSLWERMVSIGHEKGRNFKGTHGDGNLSDEGRATNEDWPAGNSDSGGFGFRGGGFYGYGREYHDFNPYSPIALRPYGGWAGGNPHPAYGVRFVRSTD